MSYNFALCLDLATLITCCIAFVKLADLRHSHPAVIYVAFHAYAFTSRLIALAFGALPLFAQANYAGQFEVVRETEIGSAIAIADLALACFTAGTVIASRNPPSAAKIRQQLLTPRIIWAVAAIAIPLGVYGAFLTSRIPGSEGLSSFALLSDWKDSSWVQILAAWPGLMLLALIYYYGPRLVFMVPLSLFLLLMLYQGYHRFRVIIPVIAIMQIYLDRKDRRWPGPVMLVALVAFGFTFFSMKTVGRMMQKGASTEELVRVVQEGTQSATHGDADDQKFLDELACVITGIDRSGEYALGQTYYSLLTLPIPRKFWPEKPSPADYLDLVSSSGRPFKQLGMIVTLPGEAYANFGYLGVIGLPFFFALWLTRQYQHAYRRDRLSVNRFIYVLAAANLIQTYRDGLAGLFVLVTVDMMPLVIIVIAHRWLRFADLSSRRGLVGIAATPAASTGVGSSQLGSQQRR